MQNFLDDIKKYVSNPDEAAINKIASDLRLAMTNQDARYVATGDEQELERVRINWAQKKLGASAEAAAVAVARVMQMMKGAAKKNRVTFYYLVARELDKNDLKA